MQATDLKAEAQNRQPVVLPPRIRGRTAGCAGRRENAGFARRYQGGLVLCAASGRARRWRPWLIGGAVVLPIALYGGWDWLAATGLATILIGVLPCLAMCALGLCMGRGKSKGEMAVAEIRKTYETNSAEAPKRS